MNPARSQKLNRFIVKDYFETLHNLLETFGFKYSPDRLFNMDEKGCRLTLHHQQSVLALKGSRRVHLVSQEHAENVTIVACVNALGNTIPPMIIYKGVRQKPTFLDNLPTGSTVSMSPKGSMTTELFCKWLDHFVKYKPAGKVMLIFDGAACHLDITIAAKAEENDIELLCLPSNTTHELQPLDKAVFRSFEHSWDEELLQYWNQNPDRRLTKNRFAAVFTPVWEKCMTVANITSGFRSTGIYPFNPNIIPDEAFAPSTISRKTAEAQENLDSSSDNEMPLSDLRLKILKMNEKPKKVVAAIPVSSEVPKNPKTEKITEVNKKKEEKCSEKQDILEPVQGPSGLQNIEKEGTPEFPQKKGVVKRRKALNYKSQHVTKDLFNRENMDQIKNKSLEKQSSKTNKDDEWYCFLCDTSRKLHMRICVACHTWIHEECVGLGPDDEDVVCPRCED